jgi:hypothetical protein
MRHFYLVVDTETTVKNTVADFGAVLVTKQGEIVERFACMVTGQFGKVALFSDPTAKDSDFWSEQSAVRRSKDYYDMIDTGERSIASAQLINKWLIGIKARYNPVVTAYNIAFDSSKCRNTKININIFQNSFCLMKAAKKVLVDDSYNDFCFANGLLTKKLKRPSTTADTMAKYILGMDLQDEPHTALEDAELYETPILTEILKRITRREIISLGK